MHVIKLIKCIYITLKSIFTATNIFNNRFLFLPILSRKKTLNYNYRSEAVVFL